jgi:hypothetical protein
VLHRRQTFAFLHGGVKIYLAERLHADIIFTNTCVTRLTLMRQDFVLRDSIL